MQSKAGEGEDDRRSAEGRSRQRHVLVVMECGGKEEQTVL